MAAPHQPAPQPHSTPTVDVIASLIEQVTSPTSTNIRHAEANLLTHLSTTAVIPPLTQSLSHPSAPVRHLASILLRRALNRHHTYIFEPTLIDPLKQAILPLLESEPDPSARRGLIALSSCICSLQNTLWPNLITKAIHLSRSANPLLTPSAFSIFQSLADSIPDQIFPHLQSIAAILSTGLVDPNPLVRFAALRAYSSAVNAAVLHTQGPLQTLTELLPSVVTLTLNHPDRSSDEYARTASTVFDVLAVLTEANPSEKVLIFPGACQLALTVFSDHTTCRQARSAANEFLVFAASMKPTTMRGDGIALAAVQAACTAIFHEAERAAAPPDLSDDDIDDGDHDPIHLSLRLLYAMAKRPELSRLVFTTVMSIVNTALSDPASVTANTQSAVRPFAAAYRIMGAISEGCAADLTLNVRDVFPILVAGAHDDTHGSSTRARALEALGYVCEALDTEELPDNVIVDVANSALTTVLTALQQKESFICKQACVALEPVLTMFMQDSDALRMRVGDILRALGAVGSDIAEDAVMAIGVLVEHAPEAFNESEMYDDVIQWILRVMANTAEDKFLVRAAATSAASALLANCTDQSVVEQLARHAIVGLESDEAPLKQSTFAFFARMADVVGGSVVAIFGPSVLKAAVAAMERETVGVGDGEEIDPTLFDTGDGDADDMDGNTFEVHSAYLDEKMVAVASVGAFASACASEEYVKMMSSSPESVAEVRQLFAESVTLVDELTRYFQEDVRASAYQSLCRIAVANDYLKKQHPALAFKSEDLVRAAFPALTYCMEDDEEIEVVTSGLSSCASFFKYISAETLNEHKGGIVSTLEDLLSQRTLCQMSSEPLAGRDSATRDEEDEEEDGDAAGDLMESVGDVIVAMACSLRGYFAADFANLLQFMMQGMCSRSSSVRNKGTALGTIAAVLLYLNWDGCSTVSAPDSGSAEYEQAFAVCDETGARMLSIASDAVLSSESKTLRQNAMFLLGVIFAKTRASKKEVWNLLPQTLSGLDKIIAAGHGGHGALIDNAAGALARIMIARGLPAGGLANRNGMMRAVLSCIPVENDPTENTTIAKAVLRLAREDFEVLVGADVVSKVLSCLVSTVLAYREWSRKRGKVAWSFTVDVDPCDEICSFEDEDVSEVVRVVKEITQRVGESELTKLNLSVVDERAFREVAAACQGR